MNIFEKASRSGLRFQTVRGPITTEDLWALPLQSKSGFDLDAIAKAVNREVKSSEEESFVETKSPANSMHSLRLDILKHIIAVRLEEAEHSREASARKAERDKLLSILGDKEDKALLDLSPEELRARIAALTK